MLRSLMRLATAVCVMAVASAQASADQSKRAQRTGGPASFSVEITGSGPPMILIPGLACGGDVWKETVDHFQDRYECHVLTLAGFAGEPPIDPPLLPKVRDDLIAYIRQKQLVRPILVGHSLGGLLSYWVAATAPDAVGPVIAVDGVPFYSAVRNPRMTADSAETWAVRRRDRIQNSGPLQQNIQNRLYLTGMITDRDHFERIATVNSRSDQRTVGQGMYELLTTDLRDIIGEIKSPVLLIGTSGSSPSDEHRETKEARYREQVAPIPTHRVVFHHTSRHFIQFDEPEFLWKQIEDFLADSSQSRSDQTSDRTASED